MTGEFKSLKQALQSEPFVITAEIPPPVSAGPVELEAKIDLLKGSVHAINITDNAGAIAHMSSLAGSAIVLNKGIDPIFQITCRDRNRLAIQSNLMGASALGIRNVLAMAGDPIKVGNQPDAKAVFDVNAKTVLNIINDMNTKGQTMGGRELATKAKFFSRGYRYYSRSGKELETYSSWYQSNSRSKIYSNPVLLRCRRVENIHEIHSRFWFV